jgi:peptidoglycan/xylan/chitin deacetylase (PgdA/CDA1 family)
MGMTDLARAKVRVLLTFDIDAESVQIRESPHLPVALSKGRFARVGMQRTLSLLDKYDIRSTFFVPSWTAQQYPGIVRDVVEKGHEIAAHGYQHEDFSTLDGASEREIHEKSVRILTELAGTRPKGFRAPFWIWSSRTLGFLRSSGFVYDSSLMDTDRPYRIRDGAREAFYELPVDWSFDDWPLFEELHQPPRLVLESWKADFDAACHFGTRYFILAMHPECIGRGARIRMLEELVKHMLATKGVAFARCDELLPYVEQEVPASPRQK